MSSNYILELGIKAKEASKHLAQLNTITKNKVLYDLEKALLEKANYIKEENQKDLAVASERGLSKAFVDRLTLTDERIKSMADGVRQITDFADPIGKIEKGFKHSKGMTISQVRVPLGVIAMIFESRPNVTIDAGALALKSGNAIILRGGSDSINTNKALKNIFANVCTKNGLPECTVQLVENTDRELVKELVTLDKYVDVIIPRGGKGLKKAIQNDATVPMIETGAGICHTYIDEFADLNKALKIVINAKVQRPGVCNSLETLLVHKDILDKFLPELENELIKNSVEIRADDKSLRYLKQAKLATEKDWETEYLDLILSIKSVSNVKDAVEHINTYGSMHSESIITESYTNTEIFLNEVDAAAVYANASTRFTDGGEFGFGGEIGISTQKLHARGPMGINELTTLKYVIRGNGQIRE
ncbi:glutamate-5-semialdehyde dehydrogenase [Pseudofrancisella aestuarii]|uniref:Gamma-glutamyl phosphate reductase n=1 Tax=Pseudofrancisella aestuarii TaxID=2670347 RepID=A0ABV9TC35_9GAMM|nr:glutamate-5-semialdehyde dehydrogenase [Pseudofrancisella aestuarii]